MANIINRRVAILKTLLLTGVMLGSRSSSSGSSRLVRKHKPEVSLAIKRFIGLKADNAQVDVPKNVAFLETVGYSEVGRGSATYVRDDDLAVEFVSACPEAVIVSKDGGIFRLAESLPTIYHFGCSGTGLEDDIGAWRALCRFAIRSGLRRISLEGAIVGVRQSLELPAGIHIVSNGGQFKALDGFEGNVLVASPENEQYRDISIDVLSIDVDSKFNVDGKPIGGLQFTWISYVTIDKIFVKNCTGHGVRIENGNKNARSGGTHEVFCNYVSIRAAKNVDPYSVGFYLDGSDHCFQYGVVFGFAVGGASPGSNNFLGTWHVWSRYHEGWRQMRLGWDASGEGNRGTLEIDSPGCEDNRKPSSIENGPIGVYIHRNAIRNKLDIIINVSKWASDSVAPAFGSIIPIFIDKSNNILTLDIVDYLGRDRGRSTISDNPVYYRNNNYKNNIINIM